MRVKVKAVAEAKVRVMCGASFGCVACAVWLGLGFMVRVRVYG